MEAHVRIDKGVKRGPRRKDAPPKIHKRTYAIEGSKSVAAKNKDAIVSQIASGRLMRDVAQELGVTPVAISQYLANDPEYKAARETGIEQQLERWQAEMEVADDPLKLARAREAFRAASWRAEREHPGRWAQRSHVTIENVGDLGERLRRARERVIEPETVASTQHAALLPSPTPDASDPSPSK